MSELGAVVWHNVLAAKQSNPVCLIFTPQAMLGRCAKNLGEIPRGSPPTVAPNAGGVGKSWRISTNNLLYLKNSTR